MEKKENVFLIILKDILLFLFIIGCTIGGVLVGHKLKENKKVPEAVIVETEEDVSLETDTLIHKCSNLYCITEIDNSIYISYYLNNRMLDINVLKDAKIIDYRLIDDNPGLIQLDNKDIYIFYVDQELVFEKVDNANITSLDSFVTNNLINESVNE